METITTSLVLVTPPTLEPLTLAQVKSHLDITNDQQDGFLESLIPVARTTCANRTRRAISQATYGYSLDQFPEVIELPIAPVVSVSSITYADEQGQTRTLSADSYLTDVDSEPARIAPAPDRSWPTTREQVAAVKVTFVAGYATPPEGLLHAMRMLIAHWYWNREAVADTAKVTVPMGVDSLLNMHAWSL